MQRLSSVIFIVSKVKFAFCIDLADWKTACFDEFTEAEQKRSWSRIEGLNEIKYLRSKIGPSSDVRLYVITLLLSIRGLINQEVHQPSEADKPAQVYLTSGPTSLRLTR